MNKKMMKDKNVATRSETRMFELEVKLWRKLVILAIGPIEHCLAALCEKFRKDRSSTVCIGRHFKTELLRVADGGAEQGFTFSDGAGHIFIVMPGVDAYGSIEIADLAHECLHAADIMLREVGVRNDGEAEEAFAYTQGGIMSGFLELLIDVGNPNAEFVDGGSVTGATKKEKPILGDSERPLVLPKSVAPNPAVEVFELNSVDVWGTPVILAVGPHERCAEAVLNRLPKDYAHAEFLKKEFLLSVNTIVKRAPVCGSQFSDDSGRVFMWMPELDVTNVRSVCTLAHECLHAASFILRLLGVVDCQGSKEALAHTQRLILFEFLKLCMEHSEWRYDMCNVA